MQTAAIYARVSSDQQKEENTIASQTAALIDFAREQGYSVPDDWVIEDEGFSGASLLRPGLERLRDLAAEGHIQAVLIHSPDRLSRKYAYQVLLTEERLGWSVRGGNRQAWRGWAVDRSQSRRRVPRRALPPNRSTPPGSVSGCRRGAQPAAMLRRGGARRPALAERGPRRDAARGGLSPDMESRGDG